MREHIFLACKYLPMYNKIFIYGDSFSHPPACRTVETDMWYHHAFSAHTTAQFISRTNTRMSADNMFLQAGHDCITQSDPAHMVIALGPLQRVSMYTDGWYSEEQLQDIDYATAGKRFPALPRQTDLTDCWPYFDSLRPSAANRENINLFHPTLLWAKLYDHIVKLDALAHKHGHSITVLHMSHTEKEYNQNHPLVTPLERAAMQCNYITEAHSCSAVCQQAGIKPWDFDLYGNGGHHSTEGQIYFGNYIKQLKIK